MNYGGFGSSFGAKKPEPKPENQGLSGPTEPQKTFNYGGFGKPRDPAPKIEFQPPATESQPTPEQNTTKSAFGGGGGGSMFSGFKMPGTQAGFANKANFVPLDQFKTCLLSVMNAGLKPTEDYEKIYRNSTPNINLPS